MLSLLFSPPVATCTLIEELDAGAFTLDACREQFCDQGIDGYVTFLNMVVGLIQSYALPLSIGAAAFILLQFIFACNLRTTATIVARTAEKKKIKRDMKFSHVVGA